MKKILLTAINAKYIHSNLAVYSLKAYAEEVLGEKCPRIEIAEYTINQQMDEILMDIYKRKPDVLCLSCYIWNIRYVEDVVKETAKILPDTVIWLGGPEVSYDAPDVLKRLPQAAGVMKGEGEETFAALVHRRQQNCDMHRRALPGDAGRRQDYRKSLAGCDGFE